jgi:hypothetical protein
MIVTDVTDKAISLLTYLMNDLSDNIIELNGMSDINVRTTKAKEYITAVGEMINKAADMLVEYNDSAFGVLNIKKIDNIYKMSLGLGVTQEDDEIDSAPGAGNGS